MWSHAGVSFENTPFEVGRKESRHCQFGPHYFKKRERTSSRIFLQGTRKLGCHAHIDMHEYKLYPEYAIKEEYKKHSELKRLQQDKLKALREALAEGKPIKVISKFFGSLPTHMNLTVAIQLAYVVSGPAQKVHPLISRKIEELVQEGATNANKIQRALRQHVKSHCSTMLSPTDRAYYPTPTDIRNHMYKAKLALQLSKFDQENLALKIEEWKQHTDDTHFFRPYIIIM